MDRNTIAAFLFIAIILILYPLYLEIITPEKIKPPGDNIQTSSRYEILTENTTEKIETENAEAMAGRRYTVYDSPAEEKNITINSNLYQAIISSIGGGSIVSFKLKHHLLKNDSTVNLIDDKNKRNLYLSFISIDGDPIVLKKPWETDASLRKIDVTEKSETIIFQQKVIYNDQNYLIEKRLTFHPNSYSIDMFLDLSELSDIIHLGNYAVTWSGGLPQTENNPKDELTWFGGYVYQAGKPYAFEKLSSGIKDDPSYWGRVSGNTDWIAVRSKYFVSALIPETGTGPVEINLGKASDNQNVYNYKAHFQANEPGSRLSLYLGPLEYKRIKDLDVGLSSIMNFGIAPIRPISKGVLWLLKFLHQFIPNYGLVLVLFSVFVKILVYPLTKKSYQSTKEMQAIQPLVAELKEKHKKDPTKLNKATMKLYKEHGVNPLGGCLPLLLQMPLLFALFQVFRSTIELRNAPFVFWINDLSGPDIVYNLPFSLPIYGDHIAVLPLIMGITMFLQQKMMPTQASGQQKFMSYFMTGFFILLFNNFPSGLNLYYTLFNVFTILQQKYLTPSQQPAK
ncbi:MAG TPA: membrane protein insertase YidC [Candidatus Marinimicrobia bacterium]|nr:membrane protein insertase YidC [Candidatus Neomarinimicrobiota bacterium]